MVDADFPAARLLEFFLEEEGVARKPNSISFVCALLRGCKGQE